tara:strand:+ start:2606 stop:2926 length:321 start_codon:yes stop_codon:yes gene_type:complete
MFNNNVVNNKRLHIKIDKKLYTELRIMRTKFSMTWDDLLFYLSTNVIKPLVFEDNYIIKYGNCCDFALNLYISSDTLHKFKEFASLFKMNKYALDYMVDYTIRINK